MRACGCIRRHGENIRGEKCTQGELHAMRQQEIYTLSQKKPDPVAFTNEFNKACKLFNIRLYATLCFDYFQ